MLRSSVEPCPPLCAPRPLATLAPYLSLSLLVLAPLGAIPASATPSASASASALDPTPSDTADMDDASPNTSHEISEYLPPDTAKAGAPDTAEIPPPPPPRTGWKSDILAALKAKRDTFTFEGDEYFVGYAKYLLEFLAIKFGD